MAPAQTGRYRSYAALYLTMARVSMLEQVQYTAGTIVGGVTGDRRPHDEVPADRTPLRTSGSRSSPTWAG